MSWFWDAKILCLIVYVLVIVGIALYSSRHTKTLSEFYLGGRKTGAWMSAFAYGTSYFSAVIFIGYAGRFGWDFGLSAVWIGVGNAVLGSFIAWKVLARRTRAMTHALHASTMPEFFEKRYNSKNLKIATAVVSFIFLVPYSASVYQGLGYLFESVFDIPYVYCMVGMAVLTGLYLLLGGYMATALCDFFQGFIMIIGIVWLICSVVGSPQVGGLSAGLAKLAATPEVGDKLVGPVGPGGFIPLLSLVILTSLGSWGLPQMVHKFYAIRDASAIRRGTIISTIFALVVAGGAYFIGVFGRLFLTEKPANADMIIPQMLKAVGLSDVLMGLVVILVLSASMSTLSSIVLSSSSAISMDLVKGAWKPQMEKKKVMLLMRVLCVVFVIASLVLALNQKAAIVTLMSFSWGSLSGALLAPFLYGLYGKKTTRVGAWAGFVSGLATSIIMAIAVGFNSGQSPMVGALSMLVSLLVTPIASALSRKSALPEAMVAEIFSSVRKPRKGEREAA
nr:sodium:solute symporter [Maliibacterium massiliense]